MEHLIKNLLASMEIDAETLFGKANEFQATLEKFVSGQSEILARLERIVVTQEEILARMGALEDNMLELQTRIAPPDKLENSMLALAYEKGGFDNPPPTASIAQETERLSNG